LKIDERSRKLNSVCLIGVTGHGKSTTGNTLIGKEIFKSSDGGESETDCIKGYISNWY
jgi:ABC-type oligopeptide transport system ATPase subunit